MARRKNGVVEGFAIAGCESGKSRRVGWLALLGEAELLDLRERSLEAAATCDRQEERE